MRGSKGKESARSWAQQQAGRISYSQLCATELTRRQIEWWIRDGELTRSRPRVYSLGPVRDDLVALLWEAVLYAGPGAALTGASGAHQLGLISYPPDEVQVTSPRRCRSLSGIKVSQHRPVVEQFEDQLPVAPLIDVVLDLAATTQFNVLRHAIDALDYRRLLDVGALLAACTKGRPGSRQLRRALKQRLPGLSRCKSPLEVAFLLFCETNHLPLPRVNFRVHGEEPDMWWPELNLVVELDGGRNHGTAAQNRRDARKDALLSSHGLTVIRFDYWDVTEREGLMLSRLAAQGVGSAAQPN